MAKLKAARNKDSGLYERVSKEISFELVRHTEQCTLHRLNWDRQLLCTGSMMESNRSSTVSIHMVPLEKIRKVDAEAQRLEREKNKPKTINLVDEGTENNNDNASFGQLTSWDPISPVIMGDKEVGCQSIPKRGQTFGSEWVYSSERIYAIYRWISDWSWSTELL